MPHRSRKHIFGSRKQLPREEKKRIYEFQYSYSSDSILCVYSDSADGAKEWEM